MKEEKNYQVATIGAGCFWCTEAVFSQINGVVKIQPGYSGGVTENPTYEQVCSGSSGHAEVIQVTFDPDIISYRQVLEVFWLTHDPTTLNQQGADIGTQYRSVVFYHNENQKKTADQTKQHLLESKEWNKPIVTEIVEFKRFHSAEEYHYDYYSKNPNQPYCLFTIVPKLRKAGTEFKDLLKE